MDSTIAVNLDLNGLEKKKYNESWEKGHHDIVGATSQGLLNKKISARNIGLNEARRQFYAMCSKYGPQARELAAENLKESVKLFRNGKGWVKGREKLLVQGNEVQYCAIGAIHQANGKAEHLARLAADLAAGELFPGRVLFSQDATHYNNDTYATAVQCVRVTMPNVVKLNDGRNTTFADMKLVFKRAIELLA